MSLEGNLRDLELQEVFQLLAHGRKSGQLRINAQLAGLAAVVCFEGGATIDALIGATPMDFGALSATTRSRAQVEGAALELLTWRDGAFQFVPATAGSATSGSVRLSTEMLLVEGARRIEGWAVPAFVTVEPTHLPLLHLVPQQWEVLTQVDGQRDLPALAEALNRDLLDVAEIVHGLMESGLLMVVDTARKVRAQKTPPSAVAAITNVVSDDLWVPTHPDSQPLGAAGEDDGYDAIFDPIRIGVLTPEGLPRLRTPLRTPRQRTPIHNVPIATRSATSTQLRHAGDAAARRGEFSEAIVQWSACMKHNEAGPDVEHAREAVALTLRLKEMLNSHGAW
jgi:hypothetical protein